MNPTVPILIVFVACCSNVVALEFMIKAHPGSGNLITFAQFLFIALEGFIFEFKFGSKQPVIPMKNYIILVTMFFVTSAVNNYSLNFNISMPLHMIFKSGSLLANMALGIIILKRSYKLSKYVSVVVVTIGIVICSLMSANEKASAKADDEALGRWLLGIGMLTFSLFTQARLGIFQEQIYTTHGKHPKEVMFYNHALPLPGFALLYQNIYEHAILFSQSEPVLLPVVGVSIPKLWLILAFNVITQYICIRAVFWLASETPSLYVTMACTVRKLLNLVFSVFYFRNPFTAYHWVGALMVFGGSLLFFDVLPTWGTNSRTGAKEESKNK